jgi:hypothetical protein
MNLRGRTADRAGKSHNLLNQPYETGPAHGGKAS